MLRIITTFFLLILSIQNAFASDKAQYINCHFFDDYLQACQLHYDEQKKDSQFDYRIRRSFDYQSKNLRSFLKNQSRYKESDFIKAMHECLFQIGQGGDPEVKFQTAQFIQRWDLTYVADLKFGLRNYSHSMKFLDEAATQGHEGAKDALKMALRIHDPYYDFFSSRILNIVNNYSNLNPDERKRNEEQFKRELVAILNAINNPKAEGLSCRMASLLTDLAKEKDMLLLYNPAIYVLNSQVSNGNQKANLPYAKAILEREYYEKKSNEKGQKGRMPSSLYEWYKHYIKVNEDLYSKETEANFMHHIQTASNQGFLEAKLLLSYLYDEGVCLNSIFIQQNKNKSFELLQEAAIGQLPEAEERLGLHFYKEYLQNGDENKLESAKNIIEKAEEHGSPRARGYLYKIYKALEDHHSRLSDKLEKLAQQSDDDAQIVDLTAQHSIYFEQARKYQRQADECFESYAQLVLDTEGQEFKEFFDGDFLRLGEDLRELGSYALARQCFEKLEDRHKEGYRSLKAKFLLASMDKRGEGLTENNYESAFNRYLKIITNHDASPHEIASLNDDEMTWTNAHVELARLCAGGLGTERDYQKAAEYMDIACANQFLSIRYVDFYKQTVNKMNEEVEDKLYSRFKGFRYVSLANFLNLQGNKITVGQFKELLPHYKDLEQLFKDYVGRLNTKIHEANQNKPPHERVSSPLKQSSSDYLHAILPLKGEEDSKVPMDTLRFYGILNNFQKRDAEEGFNIFENQFCPSIINCSTGKSDSLVRYFNSSLSSEEKSRYVTRLNRDQKDFEIIIEDYLVSTLSTIIEETFSDDKEFLPFFCPSLVVWGTVSQPSHQTAFIRSCLGHHLGLSKEYVYEEAPSCVNRSLARMTATEMLTKFFEYMTPQKFIEKFKGKIDDLLNDENTAKIYLKPFTEYIEDGQRKNHRPNFGIEEKDDDNYLYVIKPHAVERTLLKVGLLRDARGEGEELF